MPQRKPNPAAVLLIVAYGVFVAADDLTVVSTMLRQIIFDLEIPLPEGLDRAAWIVNAYLIAYVVVMPFIGRLSDILGRRAVYIGSLVLFLAGSIWVPLATDLNSFICGRVLSALGGGAMVPVAMAVIGDVYQPHRRATALGTLGAVDTAGWVWGPLYGALLIRFLNWRWQFYLNVPLSLIGIITGWWALKDLPAPARRERIDWLGAILLTAGLLSLNIALLNSGDVQSAGSFASLEEDTSGGTLPLFVIAALALAIFALVQNFHTRSGAEEAEGNGRQAALFRRLLPRASPLIDLSLFRRPNFTPAILINFLTGCMLIIAMVNVPLIINVLEFEPETAALVSGYLLSGMTASMALLAYIGGRATDKLGYRPVAGVGLGLCALGLALMGFRWTVLTHRLEMAWQLVILGMGFGLVIAPVGTAVINAASATQRGIASSLVIVFRLIGMSVGLSALTSWGLQRFGLLRTQITLPDLPLSDPVYQQAIVDGLVQVTVQVLAETFIVSAGLGLLALAITLYLRRD